MYTLNNLQKKLSRFAVAIPVSISLLVTLATHRTPALTSDGQVYLQIARNIRLGIGPGWEALWVPPLHSMLIALVSWLPGLENLQTAASVVAGAMAALLAGAVFYLGEELFSKPVGVMASLLTITFPHVVNMGFSPEAEISFTALLVSALALLLAANRRTSYVIAAVSGVAFSAAYLARSEGFLVMIFTLACLCATAGFRCYRSPQARLALVVVACFFVTSSPYLSFLKKHYGAFVISPKATYVLIWMKSRIYKDNDLGEVQNPELWGLTSDGKLKWQVPSGFRDVGAYLLSHPRKSIQVYLHNLSQHIPGRIINAGNIAHYPQALPVYMALLAIAMAFAHWGELSRAKKAVLFGPFLIMLVLPIFTEGWCKYLSPYAPLLFVPATAALFCFSGLMQRRYPNSTGFIGALPVLATFLLSAWYLSYNLNLRPPVSRSDVDTYRGIFASEEIRAGQWGRQRFGPGKNYMISWSKVIYHLEGLWTAMPAGAEYPQLIDYARKNGVDYIVMYIDKFPVTDQELAQTPPELRFAGAYRSDRINLVLAFYQVLR